MAFHLPGSHLKWFLDTRLETLQEQISEQIQVAMFKTPGQSQWELFGAPNGFPLF